MADREAQFRAEMAAMRESLTSAGADAQAQVEGRLREELAAAIARAADEAAAARARHTQVSRGALAEESRNRLEFRCH